MNAFSDPNKSELKDVYHMESVIHNMIIAASSYIVLSIYSINLF